MKIKSAFVLGMAFSLILAAVPALAHRVMPKTRNELGSPDAESVIRAIVQDLRVPR